MIYPAPRLLVILGLLCLLALVVSLFRLNDLIWQGTLLTLAVIVVIDALLAFLPLPIKVSRQIDEALPLQAWRPVEINIQYEGKRKIHLEWFDHFPQVFNYTNLPQQLTLGAGDYARTSYQIQPQARGKYEFLHFQLHSRSPLHLWFRNHRLNVSNTVYVYPNFSTVSQYILLAQDNRLSQMGIVKHRRRGEGQDFHQLREYRYGDALRQIDWKASSRTRKLISREYQEERDQELLVMLDCGHRMLTQDAELSHFDHTLNAILLLSHIALRQGDAVGLGTFSGPKQWLPPRKGMATQRQILNHIYDLQPTLESPDYSQAAKEILSRQKKRALIILITNIRDEDTDDLLPALQLLGKRHLVLLASLREQAFDQTLEAGINNFDQALKVAATHQYLAYRRKTFDKIRSTNVTSLDVTPQAFTISLVNHYFDVKRSGKL